MGDLKIYEVNPEYIDYLAPHAPHLFWNSAAGKNARKFIGVVLTVNGMEYFAPLSSFKPKHRKMKGRLDLVKIKDYAVINLNNMFPVPAGEYAYVDFSKVADPHYRALLLAEYRCIKSLQGKIMKNAATLYRLKVEATEETPLIRRCNDFKALEAACADYTEQRTGDGESEHEA